MRDATTASSSRKHPPPASTSPRARPPRTVATSASGNDVSREGELLSARKRLSELKEEFYALSYRTGATLSDSMIDIDGYRYGFRVRGRVSVSFRMRVSTSTVMWKSCQRRQFCRTAPVVSREARRCTSTRSIFPSGNAGKAGAHSIGRHAAIVKPRPPRHF